MSRESDFFLLCFDHSCFGKRAHRHAKRVRFAGCGGYVLRLEGTPAVHARRDRELAGAETDANEASRHVAKAAVGAGARVGGRDDVASGRHVAATHGGLAAYGGCTGVAGSG